MLSLCCVTVHCQFSTNANPEISKNVGNKINLILNGGILIILMLLFIYSMRYNAKCRRRRRKLPHEIRLERRNKEIVAQFEDLTFKRMDNRDEYVEDDDSESTENESYVGMHAEDERIGVVGHGKLLIDNLNHFIQSKYEGYKDNHTRIVQDMLGINNPINYLNDARMNMDICIDDSDYEQL